jgi:hypothetical protein
VSQPDRIGFGDRLRPELVTAAGVLVMVVAGVAGSSYTPFWFDPDEGCKLLGRCLGPSASAAPDLLWALVWAGLALLVFGLALTGHRLRETPRPPTPHPLPAWAEALAGGLIGMTACGLLGSFMLVVVLMSTHAIPAVVCLVWLAQAAAVTTLDRRVGPADESAVTGWVAGLVVSAGAVAALVVWEVVIRGPFDALPGIDGAAIALGLLVRRAIAPGPTRPRPWSVAASALVILVAAAAVLLFGTADADPTVEGARPALPQARPAAPPRLPPPASTTLPPTPTPPSSVPGGALDRHSVHAPVDAAVTCRPEDLGWNATGWDAAMGTRSVTIVATSRADRPCYVDGFAQITLNQAGRALRLTAEPGSPTSLEVVPQPRRVGLAPGGAAFFTLLWKGYGAAADAETPQELRVTLADGTVASSVPLGTSPAPFDLMNGGTIQISPWRPGLP